MVRAVLFDLGGTLDGEGLHWLDRFVDLYRKAGVTLSRDTLRAAFDAAEARAAKDEEIATSPIEPTVERHVSWQFAHLGISDRTLAARLVHSFVESIRAITDANRRLLETLVGHGYALGVVSNGCGNVDVLCREYGYAPFLSAIVDSRRVGVAKPDPAFFLHAASRVGHQPSETLMVGDSFERDIAPAKRAGMITAWLQPNDDRVPPDQTLVDLRLTRLADLPTWLAERARVA